MSLAQIKRCGLFGGPVLGLLCYHLLPLHYSAGAGEWIEFTQAGRAALGVWLNLAGILVITALSALLL